jgi:hypothetical protein
MLVGDIVLRKGRRVAGANREVPVQRRYEGGSIFEEASLQNVRPSSHRCQDRADPLVHVHVHQADLQPRLALRHCPRRRRPPTQGMREAAARLGAELADRLHEFQALIDTDLAELNRQAKALDLPHIIVPLVKQGP